MRLISIETEDVRGGSCIINTEHVVSMYQDQGGKIKLTLTNGHSLTTMFTDLEHAVDYLQRAPDVISFDQMTGKRITF